MQTKTKWQNESNFGSSTRDKEPGANGDSQAGWATSSLRSHTVPQHYSETNRADPVMVTSTGQQLCDHQTNP